MFRGIELVAERETKAPFDPAKQVAAPYKKGGLRQLADLLPDERYS